MDTERSPSAAENRVIDAMMSAVATKGWSALEMTDIAEAAELSYGELCRLFPSKMAILTAFAGRVDQDMAQEVDVEPDEPARDRLFEVLMGRFEILAPYRDALAAMSHDMKMDWTGLPNLWGSATGSMGLALKLADIEPPVLTKTLKIQGLVALYARVFAVFMKDMTPDLSATMKALDKEMGNAERWANSINDFVSGIGNPESVFEGFDRAAKTARAAGQKFRETAVGGGKRARNEQGDANAQDGPGAPDASQEWAEPPIIEGNTSPGS